MQYYGVPTGWTVNIGDSRTNNGHAGDGSSQSNDAEIQILKSNLAIYANDYGGSILLDNILDFAGHDSATVNLEVGNEFFAWNNYFGTADSLSNSNLYALNGQPDAEGPVNYNIYAAFNRVVGSSYRIGSGVELVTITLLRPDDENEFLPVNEGNNTLKKSAVKENVFMGYLDGELSLELVEAIGLTLVLFILMPVIVFLYLKYLNHRRK